MKAKLSTLLISMLFIVSLRLDAADNFYVTGVKTDFPMAATEVPPKDFYINIGTNQGVKKGSVLDAYRVITTTNDVINNSGQIIRFKIAKLRVIHSESTISVARLVEFFSRKDTPNGIFPNVMVGDKIRVGSN